MCLLKSNKIIQKIKQYFPYLGILIGIFLVLYPFLPGITFFLGNLRKNAVNLPYETSAINVNEEQNVFIEGNKPIPLDNTLVIPKIGVDVKIIEGPTESALLQGSWHRPGTGNPKDGGNYVVTGHRFRYLPPNNTTFYNLDKLNIDDLIIVYYEGVEYDYKVSEVFIVEPEDLHVEEDLGYHVLTLYTCTPLWTSSKRLVVRAMPI